MLDVGNLYVFDGDGSTVLVLTAPSLDACSFEVAVDGGITSYAATDPLVTWAGRARDPFFIDDSLLARGTAITVTATPDGVRRIGLPMEVFGDPDRIAERVAGVVRRHGSAADPEAYGRQVADLLTPDVLPYTVGTAATFGFAGVNGRALGDNAAAVMFCVATNPAVPTGLTTGNAAASHSKELPYVLPARG